MWTPIPGKRKGKNVFQMSVDIGADKMDAVMKLPNAYAYRQLDQTKYRILFQSSDWRFLMRVADHVENSIAYKVCNVKIQYCGKRSGSVN